MDTPITVNIVKNVEGLSKWTSETTPQERLAILERAKVIARSAHQGQTRQYSGLPYVTHLERVANNVKHLNQKVVAWLHDIIEDTSVTSSDLITLGIPSELVDEVLILTRRVGESYFTFIMRIVKDGIGIAPIVKIADLSDNLSDGIQDSSRADKYRLARYILEKGL
jgi:hypothetical protein